MKKILLSICILITWSVNAQQKTIQEKLGYPKNTKLLIIHADDIGVSHSENMASIKALEKGGVSSGSIMVPCPWFPEIADYATAHPDTDLGLHLTLTSEWKLYKWGPVLHNEVKTLITDKGFLTDGSVDLGKTANVQEAENELRAQIERAIKFGIKPTHFDTHMGILFASPELLQTYIKLGREYKVPVMLNHDALKFLYNIDLTKYINDNDVIVDKIFMATPQDYAKGMSDYYSTVIKSIQPGLNVILLHAAYDNDEMKAVTIDHPDYGAAWRQADFDFFSSDACKKLVSDNNIKLITWKEIRDKLLR
jgi:predicted glycoside hydrolase/deacetylase ChbG (UPF0249 family)